jgi:YidC/Oxa1 family membrane protein insertase
LNLDLLIYYLMLPMLGFFAKVTHSYGMAIILLTLAVRIIVWPLVSKSTRSMQAMSRLQPKLKALQEKYKDNKEEQAIAMAEFYKSHKMNPMGGCLPTLIQFPILIALFGTFNGPPFGDKAIDVKVNVVSQAQAKEAHRNETSSSNSPYVAPDGATAKVVVFPGDMTVVQGETVDFSTRSLMGPLPADFKPNWKVFPKETKDINAIPMQGCEVYRVQFNNPGEWHVQSVIPGIARAESFGFINSLGKVARGTDFLKPENLDSVALILLFGITMYLSQKFTVTGPKVPDEEMDEQQKVQRDTMKMMPITVTVMFFFIPLPTGVYLYMVVSNVMQTLQTWLIARSAPPLDDPGDPQVVASGAGGSGPLPSRSPDGTVNMSAKGNTYSVDSGKDKSNGKKPTNTASDSDDKDGDDAGQTIKLPKKKKKKKA